MHWFCFVLGVIHVYESPLFYYVYHDHNGEGVLQTEYTVYFGHVYSNGEKNKNCLKTSLTFLFFCGWLHAFKFQFEDFQAYNLSLIL